MGLVLQRDPTSEERALAQFQYALRLNPNYIAARLALGQLYTQRGNCEEAINALCPLFVSGFSKGVRTQAQVIAGRCLMKQGHPRESLVYLEQVVVLNPQSVPHRCALADAYAQAGRYHDAIETYLQVLEIEPDNARARQALEALGWVEP
ncbi:MAG: tetratricopeptide repeat protein [Chloroflexota bacterium]|nr:tetratricopeptide repeat protein [Chloroflexota bacterium]